MTKNTLEIEVVRLRAAVKTAYSILWSINEELAAPMPHLSAVKASNLARQTLLGVLTKADQQHAIETFRATRAHLFSKDKS